jgi:hypothetical protein
MRKKLIILGVFIVIFVLVSSQAVYAEDALNTIFDWIGDAFGDEDCDDKEGDTGSSADGVRSCWVGGEAYIDFKPLGDDCKTRATCTLEVNPVHGDVLYTINCEGGDMSRTNACLGVHGDNSPPGDILTVSALAAGDNTICDDAGYLKINKESNQLTLKADMLRCMDGETVFGNECQAHESGRDIYKFFSCTASYTPIFPVDDCAIQAYVDGDNWGNVVLEVYSDEKYDYAICPADGDCIYDRGAGLGQGPSTGIDYDWGYKTDDPIPSPLNCNVSAVTGGWKLGCIMNNPATNAPYEQSCFANYSAGAFDFDTNENACVEAFGADAWIDTKAPFPSGDDRQTTNKCCGDSVDDIGAFGHALIFDNFIDNRWICDFNFYAPGGPKWEWESAQEYILDIKEINKLGTTNDFVSNAERWYKCDENNIGIVDIVYTDTNLKLDYEKDFARFYCYKERNNFKYAACAAEAGTDFLGIIEPEEKKRGLGSITTMLSEDSYNAPTIINVSALDIVIKDWSDYETLEFFVKFSDIRTPLNLKILAPTENWYTIFQERVLDYATSALANNEWIHIAIPIKEWKELGFLKFELADVFFVDTVEIKNIFLRPKSEENLVYCSDAEYPNEANNMWIADLDISAGDNACDSVLSYAWTGTQCCGDDYSSGINRFSYINEYYADSESGCYASDKKEDNSIFMELNYEITKTYEDIFQGGRGADQTVSLDTDCVPFCQYRRKTNNYYKVVLEETSDGAPCSFLNNDYKAPGGNVGYVYETQQQGMVPLCQYRHNSYRYYKVALGCPTLGTNWEKKGIEGYVYETQQQGMVPLCQYRRKADTVFGVSLEASRYYKVALDTSGGVPCSSLNNDYKAPGGFVGYVYPDSTSCEESLIFTIPGDQTEPTTIQYGITNQVNQICDSDSCYYPLPRERPLTIRNLYPEDYDLFVNETGNKILVGETPIQINDNNSYVLVENVSQNILFYNESFYGCSMPDSVSNAHPGLIQEADGCSVKGNYFCSMQGEWSDDQDGVDDATLRDTTKTTPPNLRYNMVTNPSFEE